LGCIDERFSIPLSPSTANATFIKKKVVRNKRVEKLNFVNFEQNIAFLSA